MRKITVVVLTLFTALSYAQDIELNGTVSVQNNQIKNVANPTDAQDAVTKAYIHELEQKLERISKSLENRGYINNEIVWQNADEYEWNPFTKIRTNWYSSLVDHADNTIVAGIQADYNYDPQGQLSTVVKKLDPNGAIIWQKNYILNIGSYNIVVNLYENNSKSGYIVHGVKGVKDITTYETVDYSSVIFEISSDGEFLIKKEIDNTYATGSNPTSDGYVVVGYNFDNDQLILKKLSNSLVEISNTIFPINENFKTKDIIPFGNDFIISATDGGNAVMIRIDLSNSNIVWETSLSEKFISKIIGLNNNIVIAGYDDSGVRTFAYAGILNSDGALINETTVDANFFSHLAKDSQENLYFLGSINEQSNFYFGNKGYGRDDVFIYKTNSDIQGVWAKNFGGSFDDGGYSNASSCGINVKSNNNIVIFTYAGSNDFLVERTKQNGSLPWIFEIKNN